MLAFAILGALTAQDLLNDPASGWRDFGKGSWVRFQGTQKFTLQGKKQEIATETKYVLTDRTDEKVVLEVYSTAMGQTDKKIQEHKFKPDPTGVRVKELSKGEEELVIAGKKIRCTWIEYEVQSDQTQAITRLWTTPEIPGHNAKMRVKLTQPSAIDVEMQVVEFEKK